MQFRLRTLLIVLALGPPVLAWGWSEFNRYQSRERLRQLSEISRRQVEEDEAWKARHEGRILWEDLWVDEDRQATPNRP